jgi:hypothetical protein
MQNQDKIDVIVQELLAIFDVQHPPVPIETMLRQPPEGLWEDVDPTQLSGTFLSLNNRYAPRMSLARLLVRHIAESAWGEEKELLQLLTSSDSIHDFARALVMPRSMMATLDERGRTAATVSLQFEVPEDDAEKRLLELMD